MSSVLHSLLPEHHTLIVVASSPCPYFTPAPMKASFTGLASLDMHLHTKEAISCNMTVLPGTLL
jgi:hypothetical protein